VQQVKRIDAFCLLARNATLYDTFPPSTDSQRLLASLFSVERTMTKLSFCLIAIALIYAAGCDAPRAVPAASNKTRVQQTLTQEQSERVAAAIAQNNPSAAKSAGKNKVALLLNWYPEAEHGGFYAAKVHGIYEKYGLDVEIRPGGKMTVVAQELLLGRVQFGVANADDVLIARNQEIPMVAIMAPIQNGPRCIMVRKDSGVRSFAEIKNMKLQIDPARPYVPFLKSKGFLSEGVELVPYYGSVAAMVIDKRVASQGYSFSEPFMAKQQGVEVLELMMSDIGYNPYASLLVATESYIAKQDDVCQRMVRASIEGWIKYLQSPSETNSLILTQNKQGLEKDALDFGVVALKPLCLPDASDESAMGRMSVERWKALSDTLVSLKIIDADKSSVDKAYTLKYLTK